MKRRNLGFLGFLGLLGFLGIITNNPALYGFFGLFGFFGFFGFQGQNLTIDESHKRQLKRMAFLGIMVIGLGVVFMSRGRLGTVFILAGTLLIIYAFIKGYR